MELQVPPVVPRQQAVPRQEAGVYRIWRLRQSSHRCHSRHSHPNSNTRRLRPNNNRATLLLPHKRTLNRPRRCCSTRPLSKHKK